LEIIQANPDLPWDWNDVSRNPNITCGIVDANADLPWDWISLGKNPMDGPYYSSSVHKRKLVKELWDVCGEELIARACHPSRLAQWMAGEPGMEGLV
jgi:hypothetical protein